LRDRLDLAVGNDREERSARELWSILHDGPEQKLRTMSEGCRIGSRFLLGLWQRAPSLIEERRSARPRLQSPPIGYYLCTYSQP
jgi:hypothetical protein